MTWTRVETINRGDQYEVLAAFQIIGCSSLTLGVAPLINVSAATGGGRALNRTIGEAQAQCYGQTSSTPAAVDRILRTQPISNDGATTQTQVFVYMVMDSGLTATLALAWVDCRKVVSV